MACFFPLLAKFRLHFFMKFRSKFANNQSYFVQMGYLDLKFCNL